MLKKAMMLAVAAAALTALVIPAAASAQWQHHTQDANTQVHAIQVDKTIQVTGQSRFQGEIGAVECQTDAHAELLAGQTTVTVTQFGVDLTEAGSTVTSKCFVDATLEGFGCTDVSSVTVEIGSGNHWIGHATTPTTIDVTTKTIQNHLHGGIFCPKTIQLTPGTVGITLSSHTLETGQLHGQLQAHSAVGAQNVTVGGHGVVTPSGTYGIKTF